ncbi:phage baseplate assembly protein V [Chromobacterium vaccinii]|uniref:phage baseplate assembly protein V n=1 Tax=Chromobacterium vaccinii TaxID=1108595 RepID=UPI001E36DF73|nr:phage baseplate assembly protein V [Chromobacterium vaccinii]MCD4483309.1 phage baseplate assembly protein V [Chromobacterium vaccinii]
MTEIDCSIGSVKLQTWHLARMECEAAANQPTRLTLEIVGDSLDKATWPKGADTVEMGSAVTLNLTPDGEKSPKELFKGFLTERRLVLDGDRVLLRLACHCSAVKAGVGALGAVKKDKIKDGALIKEVLEAAGVTLAGKQAKADSEHPQRVLPPVTPWLYARHLAAANGLVLISSADGVALHDPAAAGKAQLLKIGLSPLLELELAEDVEEVFPEASVDAWSIKEQSTPTTQPAKADQTQAAPAGKLGRKALKWRSAAPIPKSACEGLARARVARAALASRRGRIELAGYPPAWVGERVKLDKAPTSLQSPFWVGGVHVTLDDQGLRSVLQLGLEPEHFDPPAPLPAPPLMVGVIQPYQDDPAALQRLPVKLMGVPGMENLAFARLATPLAGKDRGLYLPLQPDDEVVVGFLGDAWDWPVILGATHNPKQKPPFAYGKEMPKHGLVLAKDKQQLIFDAKDQSLILGNDADTDLILSKKDGLAARRGKDLLKLAKGAALQSPDNGLKLAGKSGEIKSDGALDIKVSSSVNIS